ncbi:sigma-54 interaction domain-containing protein [Endozoicomonas atrinae]|uniref:sigma-54 interaction domain-containing protein n=1 Tax=Endozoicomonas atrinae TaxID=1333660 RepID=UPI000825E1BA|nr:sigma 54-interacting transcriptional regulator [Endozoicomonas atrinae]
MEELKWLVSSMKSVFDTLDQPVTIIDPDGCFVYYNRASARMDGTNPDHILGRHVLDVCPWLTTEESSLLRCISENTTFTDQYQAYIGSAGERMHYMHSSMPLSGKTGAIIGAIEIGLSLEENPCSDTVQDLPDIISNDAEMSRQIRAIDIFGTSDVPILIYGETGTGKELFARRAHGVSSRSRHPMICLNCAAIPETLLESTLFGTTRGAYTGAENRKGLLALADGGTRFLDELNSMSVELQSKLLRVLQDGSYRPLGSQSDLQTNFRLITALNEQPLEAISKGKLREDLYYRIAVGLIEIPPLRQRIKDIAVIAKCVILKYGPELKPSITCLGDSAVKQLEAHDWPGNVRELENVIRRSLLLAEDKTTLDRVEMIASHPVKQTEQDYSLHEDRQGSLKNRLSEFETSLIQKTIQQQEYNLSAAARDLELPRTTLISRMKALGITRPKEQKHPAYRSDKSPLSS